MLKVGDLVVSKAGGPRMNVAAVNNAGVYCYWFSSANLRCDDTFPPETLELWSDYEARERRQMAAWNAEQEDYDPLADGRSRVTGY